MKDIITLDHGSGGRATAALISDVLLPAYGGEQAAPMCDAAMLGSVSRMAFTTDSFVIDPLFFPGGDIGELCVYGTVNDLAVSGARPLYMSVGMIIEEGFELEKLRAVAASIGRSARRMGVSIVTGDTKVVERGRGHGLYINTSGIGEVCCPGLSPLNIREGDAVIVSGTLGDHGAAVMLARGGLGLSGELVSDCAPVNELTLALTSEFGQSVRVMRDPTRGGAATVLNEFAEDSNVTIELVEDDIPVLPAVSAACGLLGLDPLYCACEGRFIAIVEREVEDAAVSLLRSLPGGESSAVIGRVSARLPARVLIKTAFGGARILQKLTGAQLPRIC